jgi:hypothetical protein
MNPRLRSEKPASTSNCLILPRTHISCGLGRVNYFKLWLKDDDYIAFGKICRVRVNIPISCNGPTTHSNYSPKRCTCIVYYSDVCYFKITPEKESASGKITKK